jgi:hypothetical protein
VDVAAREKGAGEDKAEFYTIGVLGSSDGAHSEPSEGRHNMDRLHLAKRRGVRHFGSNQVNAFATGSRPRPAIKRAKSEQRS